MNLRTNLLRRVSVTLALVTAVAVSGPAALAATAAPAEAAAVVSSSAYTEGERIWKELQGVYTEASVSQVGLQTTVTFAKRATGQQYSYTFTADAASKAGAPDLGAEWDAKWTEWQLNRRETKELAVDGANAAVIYALAAAAGCAPCIFGAIVEGNWATQANNYYNRGNCAAIKYWFAIKEYSGGYCK